MKNHIDSFYCGVIITIYQILKSLIIFIKGAEKFYDRKYKSWLNDLERKI